MAMTMRSMQDGGGYSPLLGVKTAAAAPANTTQGQMTYDEYRAAVEAAGNLSPFMYAPEAMARSLGYGGQARIQTGWGGSPSELTGEGSEAQYALDPGFETFLKQYRFQPGMQGKNPDVDIYDASGQLKHENFRTGDHKGSMMKFMSIAVPALVAGGFGGAAAGAMGYTGVGANAVGGALSGGGLEAVRGGDLQDILKAAAMGGAGGAASGWLSGAADSLMAAPGGADALASAPSFFEPGASFLGESVGAPAAWTPDLSGSFAPANFNTGFLDGGAFLGEPIAPLFDPGAAAASPAPSSPAATDPWRPLDVDPGQAPEPSTASTDFFEPGSSFLGESVPPAPPMATNPLTPWDLAPAPALDASFLPPGSSFLGQTIPEAFNPPAAPAAAPAAPEALAAPAAPEAPRATFEELRAAEHADMGQAAGNAPKTVNLGSLGGTMATAGGMQGAADLAAQQLRDATASSEIGGSVLSQAGSLAGDALSAGGGAGTLVDWIKENPTLARTIGAVGGGLLGALDGTSGGGGGAAAASGPPKAWSSALQMGIQPGAYQARTTAAPAAIRPSSGMRMSGAARYFGG